MSTRSRSLQTGRNIAPLTEHEIRMVGTTFLGMDAEVNFSYGSGERTRCRVIEKEGEIVCEIIYGEDIYPGKNFVDPNSSLSMRAAVAHELSHFHRWKDKMELDGKKLEEIDEALTSLDAILRYQRHLSEFEVRQLVADAIQRLQNFARDQSD